MKQLTGLDGSFLYMESSTNFGHVCGLAIYERPRSGYAPYDSVYRRFASKVGELEPLHRRIVEVPFHLDHPYWIRDPNFDLDFHIRQVSLAEPGRVDQLAEEVARIVGRPMDRTRPLWEVYVIEGLESGRWGLLTKYHHATIDGASGVLMLNLLNDLTPDAPPPVESPPWETEPIPSNAELLRLAIGNLARSPVKSIRLQLRMVRQVAEAAGVTSIGSAAQQASAAIRSLAAPGDRPRFTMPTLAAPPTPWNKSVTAHRRFAMRSVSLGNLKRLKDATGGTVNDVIMAICAGALRNYLERHDALPDKPLRALVPVSIRTGEESEPWTNRVSGLVVDLPTNSADPLDRVTRCREAMVAAKQQFELVPAGSLVDIQQYSPPVVATSAIRLAARLRLADHLASPVNVLISNVPGPRQPLYLDGARMAQYIPVSTVADGMGLNITAHSYLDQVVFGLVACRELVPDLWDLVDLHVDEVDQLFAATGAERPGPEPPRPMRTGEEDESRHARRPVARTAARAAPRASRARQSPARKAPASKAPTKKAPASKAPTKKAPASKAAAKKAPAKRSSARAR